MPYTSHIYLATYRHIRIISHHLVTQTTLALAEKVHRAQTDRASALVQAIYLADASPPASDDDGLGDQDLIPVKTDTGDLVFNVNHNGTVWYLTYNDIVMNAKLQLERPMSKDPVMPESQTNICHSKKQ